MNNLSYCCNAEIRYKQTCSKCGEPTITGKGVYEMFDEIDRINSIEDIETETLKKDRDEEQSDSNWWKNMDNQFTVCFNLIQNGTLKEPMDVYDFFRQPWKYS